MELDARHVNPIIQARFQQGEIDFALQMLDETDANVHSYNGLLKVVH